MEIKIKERDFRRFYCELVTILTNYEQDEQTTGEDLYDFLVDLQARINNMELED